MRAVWTTRAAVISLGASVLASAAWFWQASRRSGPELDLKGANVLLVTIDTLRADRLGAYGSRAGLTPTLDALRQQRRAIHACLVSRAGHASRARQHPDRTAAAPSRCPQQRRLPPGSRAGDARRTICDSAGLPHRRRSSARSSWTPGSASTAASTNTTIDTAPSGAAASFHFAERPADQVLRAATAWITRPKAGDARPWFAWVHLFDPHAPYRAPAAFARDRDALRCRGRVDRFRARRGAERAARVLGNWIERWSS